MNEIIQHADAYKNDEMIKLSLDDGNKYTVQRAILCGLSDYLKKALTGGFMETGKKELKLPGCTTSDVEFLIYWVSHSKFPDFVKELSEMPGCMRPKPATDNDLRKQYDAFVQAAKDLQIKLVRLWIAADMWLMPRLQNEAMRALLRVLDSDDLNVKLSPETARVAWEETAEGSRMRAMMMWEARVATNGGRLGTFYSAAELDAFAAIPGLFEDYAAGAPDMDACDILVRPFWEFLVPEPTIDYWW
ncbi:unnamed protein product [Lecanosticta acicola]|uniref:Unnamed protein product n=1 Tax=Lecanosticta acicola TaxID=111012 RepID=A0AAI9ECE8_9PEZI|nr:unnamed protein product [Lecanosticta acicola]